MRTERYARRAYPTLAQEAAMKAATKSGYATALARGTLKPFIFAPTGPGERTNDHYIPVRDDLIIASSLTGGRLFGFGIRTSKTNNDHVFRIDYWDERPYGNGPLNRPTPTQLHVHYHIYSDKLHRTIWP